MVNKTPTCWLWEGATRRGYGLFKVAGRQLSAHRFSWEISRGALATGVKVLHKCDVPGCVNPEHLFLGTQRDNVLDAISKGRHVAPDVNKRWQRALA